MGRRPGPKVRFTEGSITVWANLPPDLVAMLDDSAKRECRSRAAQIEWILRCALDAARTQPEAGNG